ncbi:hypothetical protein Taro_019983 [Colocasia esculenta]|uniref:BED-type domain-containing protein n=1 Tax=Colocasia esculenta TaxID=4460 RepID=A0A843UV21_COLES|nr:hypothetical protein [Colocasia esculenta]
MAEEGHEEGGQGEEQSPVPQLDIGWRHGVLLDAASKRVQCNHCGKEMNGGVYRLKQHIAGINIVIPLATMVRCSKGQSMSSQDYVGPLKEGRIDAMIEEHPLNAWVETRQERDVPEFDPHDCSRAEGELDGVEARDPELRKQNIREAEEKDKGMDKGDMKDNNVMQPMSGHLGSQAIVQDLLIYLHFSLPFYRTQILAAHLLEYKEDGDLGLHKNKSIVKQQAHTNRLAYGVQLHHNLEKAQVNNLHQEGFKWL